MKRPWHVTASLVLISLNTGLMGFDTWDRAFFEPGRVTFWRVVVGIFAFAFMVLWAWAMVTWSPDDEKG